jgi:dephospho-CoA kinase
MIISLTGFMGCGKSSVGRELSKLLCCPFMDLDDVIVETDGRSIPEIFAAQNDLIGNGQTDQAKEAYRKLAGAGHVAADCIGCGQCEGVCPQHIQIIGKLKECAASLE